MAITTGSLEFIRRDELYKREKPYVMNCNVKDFAKTNILHQQVNEIHIEDIRNCVGRFTLRKNGFTVMNIGVQNHAAVYGEPEVVEAQFLPGIAKALKLTLQAESVQIYEYLVRKRHDSFPISTGQRYQYQQPATVVHIDTTPDVTTFIASQLDPEKLSKGLKFQIVNIWLPLHGPLRDWPLALCDMSSVDIADLHPVDMVFSNRTTETFQVNYNPSQKWYYLSDQMPSEAWVFLSGDSHGNWRGSGTPHAAFALAGECAKPRESIEMRCLVWYREDTC